MFIIHFGDSMWSFGVEATLFMFVSFIYIVIFVCIAFGESSRREGCDPFIWFNPTTF
jgi:hypothetical protein